MEVIEEEKPTIEVWSDPKSFELVKDLKAKLAFISKASTGSSVIPILENVCFDNGYLSATDLTVVFSEKTSIKGSFLFPEKLLKGILNVLNPTDKISFNAFKDTYKVEVLINGEKLYTIDSENINDWPKYVQPDVSLGYWDREKMILISMISKFNSNDGLRPAMNGVYFDGKKMAATNAHYLAWKHFLPESSEAEFSVIIPEKAAKNTELLSGAEVSLKTSDTWVLLEDKGRQISFRSIDERFPDFLNVIPIEHKFSCDMNKKTLEGVINKALITANKVTHLTQFKFDEQSGELLVESEDMDFNHEFSQKVGGISNVVGAASRIGFNGKYLSHVLRNIPGDELTIYMSEPNKALKGESKEIVRDKFSPVPIEIGFSFILIPVMIGQYE